MRKKQKTIRKNNRNHNKLVSSIYAERIDDDTYTCLLRKSPILGKIVTALVIDEKSAKRRDELLEEHKDVAAKMEAMLKNPDYDKGDFEALQLQSEAIIEKIGHIKPKYKQQRFRVIGKEKAGEQYTKKINKRYTKGKYQVLLELV